MSAYHIYDNAPLGSLVRYSDGMPKPPARFNRKLAAWQNRNGVARPVKKQPQRDRPTHTSPASITLHEGDFASGGVVVLTVRRTYSVDSDLCFEIANLIDRLMQLRNPIGHLRRERELLLQCRLRAFGAGIDR